MGARSGAMFTIQGPTSSALAETTTALLTVKNSASNQFAFMDASCKADSALSVDAGAELSVSLATGAHKFWVARRLHEGRGLLPMWYGLLGLLLYRRQCRRQRGDGHGHRVWSQRPRQGSRWRVQRKAHFSGCVWEGRRYRMHSEFLRLQPHCPGSQRCDVHNPRPHQLGIG